MSGFKHKVTLFHGNSSYILWAWSRLHMIRDFEILCISDWLNLDLDMICITHIYIYTVVFMGSIPRMVSSALAFGCFRLLLH